MTLRPATGLLRQGRGQDSLQVGDRVPGFAFPLKTNGRVGFALVSAGPAVAVVFLEVDALRGHGAEGPGGHTGTLPVGAAQ